MPITASSGRIKASEPVIFRTQPGLIAELVNAPMLVNFTYWVFEQGEKFKVFRVGFRFFLIVDISFLIDSFAECKMTLSGLLQISRLFNSCSMISRL